MTNYQSEIGATIEIHNFTFPNLPMLAIGGCSLQFLYLLGLVRMLIYRRTCISGPLDLNSLQGYAHSHIGYQPDALIHGDLGGEKSLFTDTLEFDEMCMVNWSKTSNLSRNLFLLFSIQHFINYPAVTLHG